MEETYENIPYYKLKLFTGFCFFLGIALVSLYIFTIRLYDFLSNLYYLEDIVTMHKSMYAFFGSFIICISLVISVCIFRVFKIAKESDYTKTFSILLLSGLALMLIIPNAIHFSTSGVLEKNGYTFCSEMSHITFKFSKRVYVKDPKFCVKEDIFQ